jgi:hypothetical protein
MHIIHTSIGYILKASAHGYQVTENINDAKQWKTLEGAKRAEQNIRKIHSNTLPKSAITILEMEEKIALLSHKKFIQPKNTPLCCDPSSETYYCM